MGVWDDLSRLVARRATVTLTQARWMTLGCGAQACLLATVGQVRIYKAYGLDGSWYFTATPGSTQYRRFPNRKLAERAAMDGDPTRG